MSTTDSETLLTEAEEQLRARFGKDSQQLRVPSTAREPQRSPRIDQLVLPDHERARMPFTKDKYLVKENPHLVQWERETRKFLRKLTPLHGHRVAAVMIYEWATGISIRDLMAEGGSANSDLRHINKCLRHYFGKGYMTTICGRKVPNAFRVKPGYHIKRIRPMTLTLYAEHLEGSLDP